MSAIFSEDLRCISIAFKSSSCCFNITKGSFCCPIIAIFTKRSVISAIRWATIASILILADWGSCSNWAWISGLSWIIAPTSPCACKLTWSEIWPVNMAWTIGLIWTIRDWMKAPWAAICASWSWVGKANNISIFKATAFSTAGSLGWGCGSGFKILSMSFVPSAS